MHTPQLIDSESMRPDTTLAPSLHAPLLIKTSTGKVYVLPYNLTEPIQIAENPDAIFTSSQQLAALYSNRIELNSPSGYRGYLTLRNFAPEESSAYCTTSACFDMTGRGLYLIHRVSEERLEINQQASTISKRIDGQAFKPSQNRDYLAVWNHNQIVMYFLSSYRDGRWQIKLVNETTLDIPKDVDTTWLSQNAVWNEGGTQFAYTDADRVWLWQGMDIGNAPRLIVPTDGKNIPIAQYFSPRGRYLAIVQGEERFTLDLFTDTHFPYGIVSTNENFLAWYSDNEDIHELTFCYLRENNCDENIWMPQTQGIVGTMSNQLLILGCEYECDLFGLHTAPSTIRVPYNGNSSIPRDWANGTQMEYEPIGDNLAILNNETTISSVYNVQNEFREDANKYVTLDLADSIEGDIVSIEWLPSHFYMYE